MAGKRQKCLCSCWGMEGFCSTSLQFLLWCCQESVEQGLEAGLREGGTWEDAASGIFERCGEESWSRPWADSAPCFFLWKGKTEPWCPPELHPHFRLCPDTLAVPPFPNPSNLAEKRAIQDLLKGVNCWVSHTVSSQVTVTCAVRRPFETSPKLVFSTLAFPQPGTFSGVSAVSGPCGAEHFTGGGCLWVAPWDEAGTWSLNALEARENCCLEEKAQERRSMGWAGVQGYDTALHCQQR